MTIFIKKNIHCSVLEDGYNVATYNKYMKYVNVYKTFVFKATCKKYGEIIRQLFFT